MDNGLIFSDEYYLQKIIKYLDKIKEPLLAKIVAELKEKASVSLLNFSKFQVDNVNKEIIFCIEDKEFRYTYEKVNEILGDELFANVMSKASVSLQNIQELTKQQEEEVEKYKKEIAEQEKNFKLLLERDELTGSYSNKKLAEDLIKYDAPGNAIIMGDVNFLKMTNDTMGHSKGDELIITIADELENMFPDKVYRNSGDEFYVLISGIKEFDLKDKIEIIKENLAQCDIIKNPLSIGYAYIKEGEHIENAKLVAESRMYKDKEKIKKIMNIEYDDSRILSTNSINKYGLSEKELNDSNSDNFVYNKHLFEVAGVKYECIIAPITVDEDIIHPEIFCYIKNDRDMSGSYVSSDGNTSIRTFFGKEEFILRGRFVNSEFESSIITTGETLSSGYQVENQEIIKVKPKIPTRTAGHAMTQKNGVIIHALPINKKNNEFNICESLICIEDNGKKYAITTEKNKNTMYNNIDILTQWKDNKYKLEVL